MLHRGGVLGVNGNNGARIHCTCEPSEIGGAGVAAGVVVDELEVG
jgi:hypothetical protein